MKNYSIVDTLMARDGLLREEAEARLADARRIFYEALDGENDDYNNPAEVLEGELGLEPDYIFDLL